MATVPSHTRTMTADELLSLQGEGRRELIEGILREMPPAGADHGAVALQVGAQVLGYAQDHGGRAFAAETGFLLAQEPDTVRAPDAAYVGRERADAIGSSPGFWPGPPDLAAEVLSPGDTYSEVHDKVLAWLAAGCQVVLVVDPSTERVTRYRGSDDVVTFSDEERVDCAPAMPGFAPAVTQLLATEPAHPADR